MEKRIFVKCEDHDIPMVIVYPDDGTEGPYPAISMLHGFMAYKEGDGYMFRKAAEEFRKNGIASARIDFCSMGENRYSRENYGMSVLLKETETAFRYLQEDPMIDESRIGILGHSLGGRVTFLSSKLPSKCLITLNGAVNVYERMENMFPKSYQAEEGEEFTVLSTSDGRKELLYPRFFEENSKYVSKDIFSYTNPILVCVGADDPTLDPKVSYDFVENCNMDNVDQLVIQEANHTFNAKTR